MPSRIKLSPLEIATFLVTIPTRAKRPLNRAEERVLFRVECAMWIESLKGEV